MKKAAVSAILVPLLVHAAALTSALAGASDNQSFLTRARQAYYSLRDQGLQAFKCDILPNWELTVQDVRK